MRRFAASPMALLTSLVLVLGCGVVGVWSTTIPTEIGVTSASATSITLNSYSGPIPTQLGLLTLLTANVNMNAAAGGSLTGTIPTELGSWTNFANSGPSDEFTLASNHLRGTLPTELGQWTAFSRYFNLNDANGSNKLKGTIPTEFGRWSRFTYLFGMQMLNSLNGTLPTQFGMLTGLSYGLYLQSNQLTGPVPSELGLLTSASQFFMLHDNKFCDDLPAEVSALSASFVPTSYPSAASTNWNVATGNDLGTPCCETLPSVYPTCEPTWAPTSLPSLAPTLVPTRAPTLVPTSLPTLGPIDVANQAELQDAIDDGYTVINIKGDINFTQGKGGTESAISIQDKAAEITINGNGYTAGFESSTSSNGRCFYISDSDVTMNDLTIKNGYVYETSGTFAFGGAIYVLDASLTLISCSILRSIAQTSGTCPTSSCTIYYGRGGGIYAKGSSTTIVVSFCAVSNNTVISGRAYGAGIYIESADVNIIASTLSGNAAVAPAGYALGGAIETSKPETFLEIMSSIFSQNSVDGFLLGYGGALYLSYSVIECTGCYFVSNSATDNGDDLYDEPTAPGTFSAADCSNGNGSDGFLVSNVVGAYNNYDCGGSLPPTAVPSSLPSLAPTLVPTRAPTLVPTSLPTTSLPSFGPTLEPSPQPSLAPTSIPTLIPTAFPTVRCPRGTYFKTGECHNCTAGRFSKNAGTRWKEADPCGICSEGRFSYSGAQNCTYCPAGTYNDDDGTADVMHAGISACTDCPEGEFSNAARFRCYACKAGEYAYNNEECIECEGGRYGPVALSDECLPCYAGARTNNLTGATACTACDAGTYSEGLALECSVCPTGTYSSTSATACTPCPKGFFGAAASSSTCTACESGTAQPKNGSTSCTACESGKYQSATGQASCTECDAGKYSGASAALCSECAAGKYQDSTGMTDCLECSAGRYVARTGASFCDSCPEGAIAVNTSSTTCQTCSTPTTTNSSGRISCFACVIDYFWDDSADCEETPTGLDCCSRCPDGAACGSGTFLNTLTLKTGSFRFTDSSSTVYDCAEFSRYADNCGGGTVPGDTSCLNNAEGPWCALCKKDYFHAGDSGFCEECSGTTIAGTMVPVIVVVSVLTILAVLWRLQLFAWLRAIRGRIESWADRRSVSLAWWIRGGMIVFFDFQIITKFTEMQQVDWPLPFSAYVGLLDLIFLDLRAWVPSVECAGFSSYTALLMWTLTPIVIYLAALVAAALRVVLRSHRSAAEGSGEQQNPPHKLQFADFKVAMMGVTELALGLVSLIHTLICVRIFQMFDCIAGDHGSETGGTINEKGNRMILSVDYSLDCESSEHKRFTAYVYFMVVIYVVLVPASMALQKREQAATKSSPGLLSQPYKKEYWWFDAADLYYRLSMTGFLLLVSQSANMRIIFCTYLAITYLAYITYIKPYLNDSLNKIMMTGQFVVCITVTSGYIVKTLEEDGKEEQTGIGWLLLLVNLSIVAITVYQQRAEPLFAMINTIESQGNFDPAEFARLWSGASKIALCKAIFTCIGHCLAKVELDDDDSGDKHFQYITQTILPLRTTDGQLVCDEDVPEAMDWFPLIAKIIKDQLAEKRHHDILHLESLQEGWMAKKGAINTAWRRRYFVLAAKEEGTELFYFGSAESGALMRETGDADLCSGSIKLADVNRVLSAEKLLLIELDDKSGRRWKFMAESEEEFLSWVAILQAEVEKAKAPKASDDKRKTMDLATFRKTAGSIFGLLLHDDTLAAVFQRISQKNVDIFDAGPANDEDSGGYGESRELSLFFATNPMQNPRSTTDEVVIDMEDGTQQRNVEGARSRPSLWGLTDLRPEELYSDGESDDGRRSSLAVRRRSSAGVLEVKPKDVEVAQAEELQPGQRRSIGAGLAHLGHQLQDDVNDRLAHAAGLTPPQHHADNRHGGFGAPPGDGLDDALEETAINTVAPAAESKGGVRIVDGAGTTTKEHDGETHKAEGNVIVDDEQLEKEPLEDLDTAAVSSGEARAATADGHLGAGEAKDIQDEVRGRSSIENATNNRLRDGELRSELPGATAAIDSTAILGEFVDALNAAGLTEEESHAKIDEATKADGHIDQDVARHMMEELKMVSTADSDSALEFRLNETEVGAQKFTEVETGGDDDGMRHEHLDEAMMLLVEELRKGHDAVPSIFAIIQNLGAECHRRLIRQQEEAASTALAEPAWGDELKALQLKEKPESMTQALAGRQAYQLAAEYPGHVEGRIDEVVLPALMCAVAESALDPFKEALLRAVPQAAEFDNRGESSVDSEFEFIKEPAKDSDESTVHDKVGLPLSEGDSTELKVAPVKRATRTTVKVIEYRKEKGEGHFPYSKFLTDLLRASYICPTTEDLVEAYRGLEASLDFEVVRLKNKIGQCKGPYNLHVNVLFQPDGCKDPILCEVQMYTRAVYAAQHRQHVAYELRRASKIEDLLSA